MSNFPDQTEVKAKAMRLLAEEIEFMTNPLCRDLSLMKDDRLLVIEALRMAADLHDAAS